MKARVPAFTNKQMKIAEQQLRMEYEKIVEEERNNMTRRIFKILLYVLHEDFGYGITRLNRVFNGLIKKFEESDRDEIFWEHIDRVVIDKLGLDFSRDYTENGKVVSEEELDRRARNRELRAKIDMPETIRVLKMLLAKEEVLAKTSSAPATDHIDSIEVLSRLIAELAPRRL